MNITESCRRMRFRSSFPPGKSVYPQEDLGTFSLSDIRFRRARKFHDEDAASNCRVSWREE